LADFVDRSIGIGYAGGSLLLFTLVVATLCSWRWILGSIAVETVTSRKVEFFYWTTIMFSQTLGTALGDWMADSTRLGYIGSALVFFGALVLIAGLYFWANLSHTLLFWAAFILTRPLGATLANCFDKPVAKGGLAMNDITASAVVALLMVVCLFVIPQRAANAEK